MTPTEKILAELSAALAPLQREDLSPDEERDAIRKARFAAGKIEIVIGDRQNYFAKKRATQKK